MRDLLGASGFATVEGLRSTCEDLLVYTLEELAAQLARLRSAGDGAGAPAIRVR